MKKDSDIIENVIVLRSVYGKVGMTYRIQPCKDPSTGAYPDCVKRVNSQGDMILTDQERNSKAHFIGENETITIVDGTTFDLNNPRDKAKWEAIKHCSIIAAERWEKDSQGNYKIDGTMGWNNRKPRYGTAELYVDRPGLEAQQRVSKKKMVHDACQFIFTDDRGYDGRVMKARLLGKQMSNMPDADITDYLIEVAEKTPEKIINLYTGEDITLRILFMDGKDKHIIVYKNKVYSYADVALGATDEAVIQWMRSPENAKVLELIRKDVYPEYFPKEKEVKKVK
jgi:hypothetical protein